MTLQKFKVNQLLILSVFTLTCRSTETKKADTAEPQVQEQNLSKEYKNFAGKFYKKDLPLSFPGKIFSIFRKDKEEFRTIENSDLRFLKDNAKSPSPSFQIERTALYNIKSDKEFSILLYHVSQTGIDDEHEHSGQTFSKYMLTSIKNEEPIDTLMVGGNYDQGIQIFGTMEQDLNIVVKRFDLLYDNKNLSGTRAIETLTEYQITEGGYFRKLESTQREGDYKYNDTVGWYPVDSQKK